MTTLDEQVPRGVQQYRQLGQGIKTLHDPKDGDAEVDIVAIPGLGTDPIKCWLWQPVPQRHEGGRPQATSQAQDLPFNWITDDKGLAKMFPKARIMVYEYPSAWKGSLKVRATMRGICVTLLDNLKNKRTSGASIVRPLVFIAHSMGGIVVAKALSMAKGNGEWEALATCTMGCIFFGTPFRGTNMAKYAMLYNAVFGSEAYNALISSMRDDNNDVLDGVTQDFIEMSNHFKPPIRILCVCEQVATEISSYSEKLLPSLLQNKTFMAGTKKLINVGFSAIGIGSKTRFVEPYSACLPGTKSVDLAANHRDLVRFESIETGKFDNIRSDLEDIVKSASIDARKRTAFLGQKLLTQKFVNQVRHSLECVDMRATLRTRLQQRSNTSWLTSEAPYEKWLRNTNADNASSSYLWVRGGPGLGKTNACLAAIQELNRIHLDDQRSDTASGPNDTFMAFFLCDPSIGYCTAEDVLKSLIIQIINQEESLAQHARWFVVQSRSRDDSLHYSTIETSGSGATKTATVENLWKCLQDMIDDPIVSNIHLVISNLHFLDTNESGHSTSAFLTNLRDNASSLKSSPPSSRRVKWLLTSRNDPDIHDKLNEKYITVIDLEDDQIYGGKVKNDRQKRAREAVSKLSLSQKYSSDTAYYVRNSIESQSEDERWIECICILLRAMPTNSSYLKVKQVLREVGQHKMHHLVDHTWTKVLQENVDVRLELDEILLALTLAYESPTIADLAVLTQINDSTRLMGLVQKCSPVLLLGDQNEQQSRVVFTHPEFKDRLSTKCHGSGTGTNPHKQRYHGLMALRCFASIKATYALGGAQSQTLDSRPSVVSRDRSGQLVDNTKAFDFVPDEEEMNGKVPANSPPPATLVSHYPIKYLFHHLKEGFPDVAAELFDDDPEFWGKYSGLRTAWLKDFELLTTHLKDLKDKTEGMTAVHVAAALGANEVIETLLHKNTMAALSWTSDNGMTPLHVAAFTNQLDTVNLLIRQGADIEAGDKEGGTALHFAALQGHCKVMEFLIQRGANVNSFSEDIGPVINAAIRSGTVDAVRKIMNEDVRFDFDYTRVDPPLSLSAGFSKPELFRGILESGKEKWLQNAKLIDQALVQASRNGQMESVHILLNFEHRYTNDTLNDSILLAAVGNHWTCVDTLLDYAFQNTAHRDRSAVKLGNVFYLAATCKDQKLDILRKIWSFSEDGGIPQEIIDFALYQTITKDVRDKESTVSWLLETCGADANATTEQPSNLTLEPGNIAVVGDWWNPLNAAANVGNADVVGALIDHGAEIEGERAYALHLAAKGGHSEVVKKLIWHGAAIDKVVPDSSDLNFHCGTALQAACDNSRPAVVRALIHCHADPNLGGGPFGNPVTSATQKASPENVEILKLLLDAEGIDVNVTGGEDASTPLINAATRMSPDIVELLVKKGAQIDAKNGNGDTALIMAAVRGDKIAIETLCNAGADVTYQSPIRGMPLTVAAEEANTSCASMLGEKMRAQIERYRQQVTVDYPKMHEEDKAKLEQRNRQIETLDSRIAEKDEELELANNKLHIHELEQRTFLSESALRGQTYNSVGEQIRAVQSERDSLQRQLYATNGQLALANDTVRDYKDVLEKEREKTAELKRRHGFIALQEERDNALAQVEEMKRTAEEESDFQRARNQDLEDELQELRSFVLGKEEELKQAQTAREDAYTAAEVAEKLRQDSEEENRALQSRHKELEDLLLKLQEATHRNKERVVEASNTAPPKTNGEPATDATYSSAMIAGTDSTPVASPPVGISSSYGFPGSGPASPPIQPSSPPLVSPGGTSSYFRSIHGKHRADGSFGGYRKNKANKPPVSPKRQNGSSLYSNRSSDSGGAERGVAGPQ